MGSSPRATNVSPVYVQKKMPCRITFDGKGTVGGGIREGVQLSKYGAFRCVMEEVLKGDYYIIILIILNHNHYYYKHNYNYHLNYSIMIFIIFLYINRNHRCY